MVLAVEDMWIREMMVGRCEQKVEGKEGDFQVGAALCHKPSTMRRRSSVTGLAACITVGNQTQPSSGPSDMNPCSISTLLLCILLVGSLAVQISVLMGLGVMVLCSVAAALTPNRPGVVTIIGYSRS